MPYAFKSDRVLDAYALWPEVRATTRSQLSEVCEYNFAKRGLLACAL